MKKFLCVLLPLLLLLPLAGCGRKPTVTEISPGDGLPTFSFSAPMTEEKPEPDANDPGLFAVYRSPRNDVPDVLISRYEKEDGETLESFGARLAEKHRVFCNMTTYGGVPTANVTYHDVQNGNDRIVRTYLFDGKDSFVRISLSYQTQTIALGDGAHTVGFICGFSESRNADSVFPEETVYTYEDEYLPTIRLRRFAKTAFPEDTYDETLTPGTTRTQYGSYAEGGWTPEEIAALYRENRTIQKEERISRNGCDGVFIAYVENGVLCVRALLDCGDVYIMLCVEDDASVFQHVTNPLIDTIRAQ